MEEPLRAEDMLQCNIIIMMLLAHLINRQVEVFFADLVDAVDNDSTISVVSFEGQSKRWRVP